MFIFSAKGTNGSVNTNSLKEIPQISRAKKTLNLFRKKKKHFWLFYNDLFIIVHHNYYYLILLPVYYYLYLSLFVSSCKQLTGRFLIRFAKRQQGFERRQQSWLMSASDSPAYLRRTTAIILLLIKISFNWQCFLLSSFNILIARNRSFQLQFVYIR